MEKKERWWNLIEEYISRFLLLFLLVLLTYQVVARFVFSNPNSWSEELARYVFVWFVYLTACVAIYQNCHIKIDAFLDVYPQKLRVYVKILGNIIFLVYACAVAYYSYQYTMNAFYVGTLATGFRLKMAYVYAVIPISHIIMAIRLVQLTFTELKVAATNKEDS